MINNKNQNGKYHIKNSLTQVFGFFENREKTTYGLGIRYKWTLRKSNDNSVLNNDNAINIGKKINAVE